MAERRLRDRIEGAAATEEDDEPTAETQAAPEQQDAAEPDPNDIASQIEAVDDPTPTGEPPPPPIDTDVDPAPQITVANVQESLRWVLSMLMNPASQWLDCPQHGRVPVGHSCAVMTNTLMDRAQHLAGSE